MHTKKRRPEFIYTTQSRRCSLANPIDPESDHSLQISEQFTRNTEGGKCEAISQGYSQENQNAGNFVVK